MRSLRGIEGMLTAHAGGTLDAAQKPNRRQWTEYSVFGGRQVDLI